VKHSAHHRLPVQLPAQCLLVIAPYRAILIQNSTRTMTMPIISMFYGIIVRLYLLDNKHHNLPHIHAKYAEYEAALGMSDGEILSGELPRKQLRLVQAWIELHRDELMADWEIAVSGENPYKIAPL
jgi:Domain of unknown function (DUF4160)